MGVREWDRNRVNILILPGPSWAPFGWLRLFIKGHNSYIMFFLPKVLLIFPTEYFRVQVYPVGTESLVCHREAQVLTRRNQCACTIWSKGTKGDSRWLKVWGMGFSLQLVCQNSICPCVTSCVIPYICHGG